MTDKTVGIYVPSMIAKIDWSLVERKIMDVFNQSDKECLDEKHDKAADFVLAPYHVQYDEYATV